MNRKQLFLKIWHDSEGALANGGSVEIFGAGPAGLHLAYALNQKNIDVTVIDPHRIGGVRIPLMHACYSTGPGVPVWKQAKEFSRQWYRDRSTQSVVRETPDRFIIATRKYLRLLKNELRNRGVRFARDTKTVDPLVRFLATGYRTAIDYPNAARSTPGLESYWRPQSLRGQRAALIHRNDTTENQAREKIKALTQGRPQALFRDYRLVTRDSMPIVGFEPQNTHPNYDQLREKYRTSIYPCKNSPFLFCGFGYHAMTYTPYLAHVVAAHLTGAGIANENLVSALTPARFLPRSAVQTELR